METFEPGGDRFMETFESEYLRAAEIAGRQHEVITRSQLVHAGFSVHMVDKWVNRQRLRPAFRSVYSVGRPVDRWESVWMAATLAAGRGAVLAGGTAAALWGLTDPTRGIMVKRPSHSLEQSGSSPSLGPFWLYARASDSLSELSGRRSGIPTRDVPGLLVDMAAQRDRRIERVVFEASRLGCLGQREVDIALEAVRGRRGADTLRKQLRYWTPEIRHALSVLETRFKKMCDIHGLPRPGINRRIAGLKVDFVWREQRLVVELNGWAFHRGRAAFERDHQRQAILARHGYQRLAFTWWQVNDHPEEVFEAVLACLTGARHLVQPG